MSVKEDQSLRSELLLENTTVPMKQSYILPENDTIEHMALLVTKQYPPLSTHDLVPRPHLLQKLHGGTKRKLSLISAPAGFGKTTLLKEWVQSTALPVAWLSLDEHDNDPTLFWCYVLTALQRLCLDTGKERLKHLLSFQQYSIEEVLAALINEIALRPGDFALVLDNYHVITATPIHQALTFLLEHLPNQFHLVLSSRFDPPLPLARFRARGQITEIRATDLRFDIDEADMFLNQIMHLALSTEHVAILQARAEGWIAGLHLAAITLQQQQDVDTFIKAFSGTQRHIMDYFTDEVLYTQPARVQTFLLETSILEQLCSSLCAAVTGQDDSQQLLISLERSDLFLVGLDMEQRWYRYHQLFRDFLYQRLKHLCPQGVESLHRRASIWYEKHDLLAQAIEHALAGKDFERAALLMRGHARIMLAQGEPGIVLRWLEVFPSQEADSWPWLPSLHAWAQLAHNEPGKVKTYLEAIQPSIGYESNDSISKSEFAGNAALTRRCDLERSPSQPLVFGAITTIVHQKFDVLPYNDKERLAAGEAILSCMGLAYLITRDIQEANYVFSKLYRISQTTKNELIALFAVQSLAKIRSVQGKLQQAYNAYQQARQLNFSSPAIGLLSAGESLLFYQWNDLEKAAHLAMEGITLGQPLLYHAMSLTDSLCGLTMLLTSYLSLAYTRQAQGDEEAALEAMEEAKQLALNSQILQLVEYVESEQVRLWLMQGKFEQAFQWKEQRNTHREAPLSNAHQHEYQVLARIYIAQERHDLATRLLQDLLDKAEAAGLVEDSITVQVLQAVALQRQGKQQAAIAILEHALLQAEPQGYVRLLLDEGSTVAKLLSQLLKAPQHDKKHVVSQTYIKKLVDAFEAGLPSYSKGVLSTPPLQDPLSARELEVLQHLNNGLSNREIAQHLLVTVGTVKRHTNSIYSKLGVQGRFQAITQARILGLV